MNTWMIGIRGLQPCQRYFSFFNLKGPYVSDDEEVEIKI